MTGIEPANDGATTHCRNHLATLAIANTNIFIFVLKEHSVYYRIILLSTNILYKKFLKKNIFSTLKNIFLLLLKMQIYKYPF